MAQNKIQRFSSPKNESNTTTKAPLSFGDWKLMYFGFLPDDQMRQYNKYLVDWYSERATTPEEQTSLLRDNYIQLVERLALFFDDDDFRDISELDLSDDRNLSIVIPEVTKKLKQIALYYKNKRDAVKNTKLKYSMTGSENSVQTVFYEYFLNFFAKDSESNALKEFDQELFTKYPQLQNINKEFEIEIEDLYDYDAANVGKESTISRYSDNPLLFLLERGEITDTQEGELGVFAASALTNPLEDFDDPTTLKTVLEYPTQKYLGNDLFYFSGGEDVERMLDISIPLQIENNYFYFYSGEIEVDSPYEQYPNASVKITDIDWSDATSSDSYLTSDIVFIEKENTIEGAWYSRSDSYKIDDAIHAVITDGTKFLFPFPGLGLSGEGGDWSGRTLSDNYEFQRAFFPTEKSFADNLATLRALYWSNTPNISASDDIYLQYTSLVDDGAYASKHFKDADKVIVRPDSVVGRDGVDDGVYNGEIDAAWLFDFTETDFVINAGNTNIYYPLKTYTDTKDVTIRFDEVEDIALNSVPIEKFSGSVAGDTPETADKLFKYDTCPNTINQIPSEGAWLKGYALTNFNRDNLCDCDDDLMFGGDQFISGSTQSSLFLKVAAGKIEPFVWLGADKNINDTNGFGGFSHDTSCEYGKLSDAEKPSLTDSQGFFTNSEKNNNWDKCNCKAVYYSPLGHKGAVLSNYRGYTDVILKNVNNDTTTTLDTWVGSDGKGYQTSKDAAWYRTSTTAEEFVGWGIGEWVSSDGSPLVLTFGQEYFYYRNALSACAESVPYLIIKECYCDLDFEKNCQILDWKPIWHKLTLVNGRWVDAGTVSDMILKGNGFYQYQHQNSAKYSRGYYTLNGTPVGDEYIDIAGGDASSYSVVSRERAIEALAFTLNIDIDAAPYWAKTSYNRDNLTQFKATMYYGRNKIAVEDLFVTNPEPSEIVLTSNSYFEYKRSECADSCFVWRQPLSFTVEDVKIGWKKLKITSCQESDILDHTKGRNCCVTDDAVSQLCVDENLCGCLTNKQRGEFYAIEQTREVSDMTFYTNWLNDPVFVNYYARNPFVLNFSVGTGDIIVSDKTSGSYVTAKAPWKNLFNTEQPKIEYLVEEDNLKNESYFGLSIFNQRPTKFNITDPVWNSETSESYGVFRKGFDDDGDLLLSYNASNIKSKGGKASGKVDSKFHQDFTAYSTAYQRDEKSFLGLTDYDKKLSPWTGLDANKISDDVLINFRKEPVVICGDDNWYDRNDEAENIVTTGANYIMWEEDVYGNQFAISSEQIGSDFDAAKEKVRINTIGGKNPSFGNIIVARLNNSTTTNLILLYFAETGFFLSSLLYRIDVVVDYLIVCGSQHVVFIPTKDLVVDSVGYITLPSTTYVKEFISLPNTVTGAGNYFVDWWYEEDSNSVVYVTMTNISDTTIYPTIEEFSLDDGINRVLYDGASASETSNWGESMLSPMRDLYSDPLKKSYVKKTCITKNKNGTYVLAVTLTTSSNPYNYDEILYIGHFTKKDQSKLSLSDRKNHIAPIPEASGGSPALVGLVSYGAKDMLVWEYLSTPAYSNHKLFITAMTH